VHRSVVAMGLLSSLKSVDFYRKIPRDLTEASLSGAALSIGAAAFMTMLFGYELSSLMQVRTQTQVMVDKSLNGEVMPVNFKIRCARVAKPSPFV